MRATIFVAQQSELGKRVGVKDIAKAIDSPEAFTGKIMQQLTKQGFVNSAKGPFGGFWIDKELIKSTKLSDLVILFDGEKAYQGCVLGLPNCNDSKPCPLHKEATNISKNLKTLLEQKSLYDVLYSDEQLNQFWLKEE